MSASIDLSLRHAVTLVVPSKNRPSTIVTCLSNVLSQPTPPHEVIVVDQSAERYDLTPFPSVRHIYDPSLSGLTAARNAGIRAATGDVVMFIDDDCIFLNDAIKGVDGALRRHPDAIAVQAVIVNLTGADGAGGGRLSERLFERGFFDSHTVAEHPGDARVRRLSGGSMAVRRSVFDHELFDEALTGYGYGEDWEFSKRAARHGPFYLAPEAQLRHDAVSENRFSSRDQFQTRWDNFRYIYAKLRADASVADAFWYRWWMFGEALQWLRFGFGLPRSSR